MQSVTKMLYKPPISTSSMTKIPNFLLHYLALPIFGRRGHHHKRVPPSMGHKNYVSCTLSNLQSKCFCCTTYVVMYYLALKNLPKKGGGGQKRTFINPLTHNDNIHYLQMTTFTTYIWQHPLLAMKNTLTKMESPSSSTLSEKLRVCSFCLKLSQVLKSWFWACFWHLLVSQRLNEGQATFACLERDEFLPSWCGFQAQLGERFMVPKTLLHPPPLWALWVHET